MDAIEDELGRVGTVVSFGLGDWRMVSIEEREGGGADDWGE
jgi:hypothetical protein